MIFSHNDFITTIEINNLFVNTIVIEELVTYRNILLEINRQINGEKGKFNLSINNKIEDISKNVLFVNDLFNFDFQNRKIATRLLSHLEEIALENYEETNELITILVNYFNKISFDSDYDLDFNDFIDVKNILKLGEFNISCNYEEISDNMLTYFKTLFQLRLVKVIVVTNLRKLFTETELREMYNYFLQNEIRIINIEFGDSTITCLENEKLLIIDKDLCEIN